MRKLLLVTVCLGLAVNSALMAQDARGGKDPQLENIKTLRSNALTKLPALVDLFDNERNGSNAAYNSLLKTFQENAASLNKRIETEQNKPAETKDKSAIDALTAKQEKFLAMWNDRGQNVLPAYHQKLGVLIDAKTQLITLVNDLSNIDQVWVKADCDRALLIGMFTELNKRIDEVKAQATVVINDDLKKCADFEAAMKE